MTLWRRSDEAVKEKKGGGKIGRREERERERGLGWWAGRGWERVGGWGWITVPTDQEKGDDVLPIVNLSLCFSLLSLSLSLSHTHTQRSSSAAERELAQKSIRGHEYSIH